MLNLSFADGVIAFYDVKYTAADEATQSRIFAGVHLCNDLTSEHRHGREVADSSWTTS